MEQMLAAGLDATIDGVGNVYGRNKGVSRAVLIGSHTDTVPNGGWLDGAMGVIFGLEAARALRESPAAGDCGVDVISFADEEGTFMGLAGSRAFCGEVSESDISTARDLTGKSMPEAIREAGYHQSAWARLDLERHVGYLEPHIEQGPRLEAAGNGSAL